MATAQSASQQTNDWRRDDPTEKYEELTETQKGLLQKWIELAIEHAYPRRAKGHTSYGMKHDFERVGFYLTNGQFKGAMLAAGYRPIDDSVLNWEFRCRPRAVTRLRPEFRHDGTHFGYALSGCTEAEWRDYARLMRAADVEP